MHIVSLPRATRLIDSFCATYACTVPGNLGGSMYGDSIPGNSWIDRRVSKVFVIIALRKLYE
jgi:hypothetical protein